MGLEADKEALRIQMENEAILLKEKMENENQERSKNEEEMKAALDKEKAAMEEKLIKEQMILQEKMEEEAAMRLEKEKEMQAKMEKTKESGNELIELFEKVKKELEARKKRK